MSLKRMLIMMANVTLLMMVEIGAKVNVSHIYSWCSNGDNPGSDYQSLVEKISRGLIKHTSEQNYYHYDQMTEQSLTCYGHAICRHGISFDDCIACLHAANTHRIKDCKFVMGLKVSLEDCYMQIEDFDFNWDTAGLSYLI